MGCFLAVGLSGYSAFDVVFLCLWSLAFCGGCLFLWWIWRFTCEFLLDFGSRFALLMGFGGCGFGGWVGYFGDVVLLGVWLGLISLP